MSSRPAVLVDRLSKAYTIAHRDTAQAADRGIGRRLGARSAHRTETLWALRDVSFEVAAGTTVGVIGRNGAGKSTLLKILCRISDPTAGRAELWGRVASLLEVGTGFHPELTGRENIFLNGSILGMRRREIRQQFDAIVDFAGISRFLDVPVKRYSSGMYMRLAFAVAAHLDAAILVVDEVLAVGDTAFQRQCLAKMEEVATQQGRTVLFVSHNMGAVAQTCATTILLSEGSVEMIDRSDRVIEHYLASDGSDSPDVRFDPASWPAAAAVVTRAWVGRSDVAPVGSVDVRYPFIIALDILVRMELRDVDIGVRVTASNGVSVFTTSLSASGDPRLGAGTPTFHIEIPGHFLAPGRYSVTIGVHRPNVEMIQLLEHALSFNVEETGSDMWAYRGGYGLVLVRFPWQRASSRDERSAAASDSPSP